MKTTTILSLALLSLTFNSLAAPDPKDDQERAKFVGLWKGWVVEGTGENPNRGPVKLELRITGTNIAGLEFKGTNIVDHGQGPYTLDLTKNPPLLDAYKTNERGRKQEFIGIYTLEGDTLRWCVSPRKTRPAEFRTGDGGFLAILKRQPAEAGKIP